MALVGSALSDVAGCQLEGMVGAQSTEHAMDFLSLVVRRIPEDAGVRAELVGRCAGENLLERTISGNEPYVLMKALDGERFTLQRILQECVTVGAVDDRGENASCLLGSGSRCSRAREELPRKAKVRGRAHPGR